MGTLTGKYAIVTGAGKGIGKAIVKRFLDDDIAGVAMIARSKNSLIEVAKELDSTGERTLPIRCDVSNREDVKAAVDIILGTFGTVDILVNNAGIIKDRIFHRMSDEEWNMVIDINLHGTYYMCKHIVPILRDKGYGRIVNISSTSALGNPGQANYSATKAAIEGFTKTLAKELGSKGVIVNAVAPGWVSTDMLSSVPEKVKEQVLAGIPLGRFADPSEIAGVVSFLSGPDCSFLSSQVIYVCGGVTTG